MQEESISGKVLGDARSEGAGSDGGGREVRALSRFLGRIEEIIGDLSGVIGDREQDFLDLGGGLMEFTSSVGQLSEKAARLAEMTAGNEIEAGIAGLNSQLNKLSEVCSLDSTESSLEELRSIGMVIGDLNGHVASFGRMVKKLSMLGISTRIESARLGSRGLGFATLADDVEKLAGKIVSNSEVITSKVGSLSGLIDSATQRTGELVAMQGACSEKIVSDLGHGLDSLKGMTDRSEKAAAGMSSRLAAIHASVSESVASMQFHDIVRQQVEHVEEAFEDVRRMITASDLLDAPGEGEMEGDRLLAAESDAGKARELLGWLQDVGDLQASQLDHAVSRFSEAVQNLIENMKAIGDNVMSIGEEMAGVLTDEREGEPVLERIESSAAEVTASMRAFTVQGEEISGLMAGVAETIGEMAEFVEGIEEVGAEIELISLNASIKAAHTGDEGKALGVLAASIQRLSMDAMDITREVSEELRRITEGSRRLEAQAADYVKTEDLEKLVARQEETTAGLKELNGQVVDLFEEVSGESRKLGSQMLELAEGTDIHRTVGADLGAVRENVSRLILDAEEVAPHADEQARSERLKELLGRYTMEAERLVHEAAAAVKPVKTELPAENEIELFDNGDSSGDVELFGGESDAQEADSDKGEIELFDDSMQAEGETQESPAADEREKEEEWDNVELF